MQRSVDKKQRQVCRNICVIRYTKVEVNKINFGIKLQVLRKDKRLSQEALAEQLGVSRQAVSKWERGEGYPEMDTIIMISNLFGVTLDYLMKDNDDEELSVSIEEGGIVLSTAELDNFILYKKRNAFIIAISVLAIIMSVSLVVFFEENSLAIGAMLIIIGLAVGSMILVGILSEKYEYLEKKPIILKGNDLEKMMGKQKKHMTTFAMMIAAGVFIIILGAAALVVFEVEFLTISTSYSITVLEGGPMVGYFLWIVAIAVFIFIYAGMTQQTYQQICNSKEYVKEVEEEEEENKYYAITMPVATAIYLLVGFLFDSWNQSWVIFPVVAILTYAFTELKK